MKGIAIRCAASGALFAAIGALAATPLESDLRLHALTATSQAQADNFKFVFGPALRWASVPVHWSYNQANASGPFDGAPAVVVSTLPAQHFSTHPAAQADASPLCRYYIPPASGNSQFYGRGTAECTRTGQSNPTFVLEDPAFMYMILPTSGTCPVTTTPVYRVFSNRADANHRYTTSRAIRDEMVGEAWLAEGDGPDRVVMCAPT